jgi:hypothetical protein
VSAPDAILAGFAVAGAIIGLPIAATAFALFEIAKAIRERV